MLPVLTLATVSLWNYNTLFPLRTGEVLELDNIRILETFTGTTSESWFYSISVAIEARSIIVIPLILTILKAVHRQDVSNTIFLLIRLSSEITEITTLFAKLYKKCKPEIFYTSIRPYLNGWNHASLPTGVAYDGSCPFQRSMSDQIKSDSEYRTYAGGSNAQSALIQALDVILGVEHPITKVGPVCGSILTEMRRYMPGAHCRFLEDVSRVSNLRQYVVGCRDIDELRVNYNACILGLKRFRDVHMQIVCRYILLPARQVSGVNHTAAKGTGGTESISFLKQVRRETVDMIVCK